MELKTNRLILRKPKVSDWKDIVEGIGDYEVSKNMSNVPYPYNKKDALIWINKTIEKLKNKEQYNFLIELKSEKKVIGCISIEHIDKFVGIATTGSWINKKYWKKGYITEAKFAANNFAFNVLKIRKLNSTVFVDNLASNKTQQSIGYSFEGCKRGNARSKASGKIKDVNLYGLFKNEWTKKVKEIRDKIKRYNQSL